MSGSYYVKPKISFKTVQKNTVLKDFAEPKSARLFCDVCEKEVESAEIVSDDESCDPSISVCEKCRGRKI